jgi:predicted DNA-binding protein
MAGRTGDVQLATAHASGSPRTAEAMRIVFLDARTARGRSGGPEVSWSPALSGMGFVCPDEPTYIAHVHCETTPLMVRTQIYLTDEQKLQLELLAAASGRKQSEMIREAIDGYLAEPEATDWQAAFEAVRGM